jgi:putative ABC transport system permease protein
VAGAILTLIALLLMFLGALLDGLLDSSTGAYRAQEGQLIVYSSDARESLVRSRITPETRDEVERVQGVRDVGGLGSVQLGARPSDEPRTRDLVSTVLFGYELAARGLPETPPPTGSVIADSTLRSEGFDRGDTLLLGPNRSRVSIVGFVDDTRYAGQVSLWGSMDTWRKVLAENRPGQAPGDTVQALVVTVDGDADQVSSAIDAATDNETKSLTLADAIEALPGVSQQRSTFNQIIGVTALVALVVVALFFALITIERLGLYGILKALGASSSSLFLGVVTQAVTVTLVAALVGVVGSMLLEAVIPVGSIPFVVTPGRLAASTLLMLVASLIGSAFSLRRVLGVDPASAIGSTV